MSLPYEPGCTDCDAVRNYIHQLAAAVEEAEREAGKPSLIGLTMNADEFPICSSHLCSPLGREKDEPVEAKPWVAFTAPMEIGGDEAVSYVAPDHEGPCAVVYEIRSGEKEWCVFPSFQEASMAAGFAVRPDIGGYGNVQIRNATEAPPGAEHFDCAVDWM